MPTTVGTYQKPVQAATERLYAAAPIQAVRRPDPIGKASVEPVQAATERLRAASRPYPHSNRGSPIGIPQPERRSLFSFPKRK